MKKLSKYRAIWMMRTHFWLTLIILSVIIGGVCGQLFLDYFASSSVELRTCIITAVVFAASLVPTLLYHARIKSLCRYWQTMPVISVDIGCTDYTQLKNAVKRTVRLHKLSDKCRYGKLHKRYGIRIFLHDCTEETYGYFESAESTVRELNRRKNIPDARIIGDRNNADSFNHHARINVFAFEYGAARYLKADTRSPQEYMERYVRNESVINLYIDVSDGKLYFPVCCAQFPHTIAKYYYCVRQFCNILTKNQGETV